jgi:hypothetical protein
MGCIRDSCILMGQGLLRAFGFFANPASDPRLVAIISSAIAVHFLLSALIIIRLPKINRNLIAAEDDRSAHRHGYGVSTDGSIPAEIRCNAFNVSADTLWRQGYTLLTEPILRLHS